jgi:hypothetical protein
MKNLLIGLILLAAGANASAATINQKDVTQCVAISRIATVKNQQEGDFNGQIIVTNIGTKAMAMSTEPVATNMAADILVKEYNKFTRDGEAQKLLTTTYGFSCLNIGAI